MTLYQLDCRVAFLRIHSRFSWDSIEANGVKKEREEQNKTKSGTRTGFLSDNSACKY